MLKGGAGLLLYHHLLLTGGDVSWQFVHMLLTAHALRGTDLQLCGLLCHVLIDRLSEVDLGKGHLGKAPAPLQYCADAQAVHYCIL